MTGTEYLLTTTVEAVIAVYYCDGNNVLRGAQSFATGTEYCNANLVL